MWSLAGVKDFTDRFLQVRLELHKEFNVMGSTLLVDGKTLALLLLEVEAGPNLFGLLFTSGGEGDFLYLFEIWLKWAARLNVIDLAIRDGVDLNFNIW